MHDKAQPTKMVVASIMALVMIMMSGVIATSATAQQTQVIGGHGGPSVEVDLSVLDDLPPLSTLPELLRPGLLPYAAATTRRLPLRGEQRMSGNRSLRTGRLTLAPKPIAKPIAPTITAPITKSPAARIAKTLAVPSKPRVFASKPLAEPRKPKISTAAPAKQPPRRATTSASASVPKAPKAQRPPKAPVIAPAKLTPTKPKPVKTALRSPPPPKAPTAVAKPVVQGDPVRLLFDDGQSAFADSMAPTLSPLIKNLKSDSKRRVQLLAYATPPNGNASKARRLSLSRALSVRAYLMAQGIASTRMDVRALGGRAKDGPANRVDIMVVVPR
jgi:outer membrane protein OmpA-like peptidoglycan-associated protein